MGPTDPTRPTQRNESARYQTNSTKMQPISISLNIVRAVRWALCNNKRCRLEPKARKDTRAYTSSINDKQDEWQILDTNRIQTIGHATNSIFIFSCFNSFQLQCESQREFKSKNPRIGA